MKKKTINILLPPVEDYILFGISGNIPAYKLCWLINNGLNKQFERTEDYPVLHKKGSLSYPLFKNQDDEFFEYIIHNHAHPIPMNNQYKVYDFFYLTTLPLNPDSIIETINSLKTIKSVQIVRQIDLHNVKEKENFLIQE